MAIEAISGKVQSEPLNRNFSYMDTKVGDVAGEINGETSYEYNLDDTVSQVTTPTSTTVFEYTDGIMTKATETKSDVTITDTFNYDLEGVLTSVDRVVTENVG